MRRLLLTGITLAALGLAATASAQVAIDTMQVEMTVIASCNVTAGTLNFGNTVDVDTAPVSQSTNINVRCSTGVPFDIALDAGSLPSAGQRQMENTTTFATAAYALYQDSSLSTAWGDNGTTISGAVLSGVGTNAGVDYAVYGEVTTAPPYDVGVYSDSVIVTVSF